MAIITISRGTLSGGRAFAECLGRELGYKVISREDLVADAARLYGVDEAKLHHGLSHGPRLLERFRVDRRAYLAVAQATLCRLVREDNVVYHGHAGHLLLEGVGHVLRLRIIAPMEVRVQAAVREYGLEPGEAVSFIEARDAERRSWTRFLYGIEWGDPGLYDLLINLERIPVEAACALVKAAVSRPEFATSDEDRRRLDDLYLRAHVMANLFLDAKLGAVAAAVEVEASDGVVRLKGILPGMRYVNEAVATCKGLAGVKQVDASWLGAQQDRV